MTLNCLYGPELIVLALDASAALDYLLVSQDLKNQ